MFVQFQSLQSTLREYVNIFPNVWKHSYYEFLKFARKCAIVIVRINSHRIWRVLYCITQCKPWYKWFMKNVALQGDQAPLQDVRLFYYFSNYIFPETSNLVGSC